MNSSDYEYLRNRYYVLKNRVSKTINFLNSASSEMSKTLDIGNYFQINGQSAESGKFGKTKADIDYIKNYLQNRVIPYLDREIRNASDKIVELSLVESAQ